MKKTSLAVAIGTLLCSTAAFAGDVALKGVEFGGVLEAEASYNSDYDDNDTSDLVLSTAEFAVSAEVNDWVSAEVTALYEEDDTDLEIDVASITIANGIWFATVGQQYLPFGSFETGAVSDPLTLELAEARESALLVGVESEGFSASAYLFNGDNKKHGDDEINSFGAALGYSLEGFSVNLGYISNLGDSDSLQEFAAVDADGEVNTEEHVAGYSVDLMYNMGDLTLIAEYIAAIDEFEDGELENNEPSTWNFEIGYSFALSGKDASVAFAYQGSDEARNGLELPEQRLLAALSVEVFENTALSFEYAYDSDYEEKDGGTDENASTVTALLSYEF